jgi:hypothetical protein
MRLAKLDALIHTIRGQRVMLDRDLAELYGVPTKKLNEAVKRHSKRFPPDFMFKLIPEEAFRLISQPVISNAELLRSQSATSKKSRGGQRYLSNVFTEQGVAMLSSVLNSRRAVKVNIQIMRTFARLRQMLASNENLARKLAALENKYDTQFKVVFDAIRQLMSPQQPPKRRQIGFRRDESQDK